MLRTSRAFDALTACLRGEPPKKADWADVFEIANRTLLTPALFSALNRISQLDVLSEEGRIYLEFIYGRNLERNLRLRAQLIEAVGVMNRVGIKPTLLKGAVLLFSDPSDRMGSRMTKDLDISVEEHEAEAAKESLISIGYRDVLETRGMERPQDVGVLELRQRPRAISSAYLPCEHERPPALVEHADVYARIPSSTSRALHWIVHDLIKEGDYWRGRIDLRHLYDLAELARTEVVDWAYLRHIMPDQFGRNVLDTQLMTLHVLFGCSIPPEIHRRGLIRLQHWRRMFTASHPVLGAPLRLAGNLAWGGRRAWMADNLIRSLLAAGFTRRMHRTLIGTDGDAKL